MLIFYTVVKDKNILCRNICLEKLIHREKIIWLMLHYCVTDAEYYKRFNVLAEVAKNLIFCIIYCSFAPVITLAVKKFIYFVSRIYILDIRVEAADN